MNLKTSYANFPTPMLAKSAGVSSKKQVAFNALKLTEKQVAAALSELSPALEVPMGVSRKIKVALNADKIRTDKCGDKSQKLSESTNALPIFAISPLKLRYLIMF